MRAAAGGRGQVRQGALPRLRSRRPRPRPGHPPSCNFPGEALETAVLLDAAAGDDAAFERDATQLGPYYTDARCARDCGCGGRGGWGGHASPHLAAPSDARPCQHHPLCSPLLPASAREGQVRGLILLRLLVQNRVADFHAELARAPAEVRAAPAVAHVAALEAWMAEGAYNQVLAAGPLKRESM